MRRRRSLLFAGTLLLLAFAAMQLRSNRASANPLGGITAVSAGELHTCAVTDIGGVKCWGQDFEGELGDGGVYYHSSATPVDVPGLPSGIVTLASGYSHTCALTDAGTIYCWGANGSAQLGSSAGEPARGPRPVPGIADAAVIAAGGDHTCAILAGGAVDCWGDDWYGQVGNSSIQDSTAPVEVQGIPSGAIGIAMSGRHTCAVVASGGVKCWGDNQFGELGDGTAVDRLVPTDVVGLTNAIAIAAGNTFTCALTDAGGVKCWGDRYGNFPADLSGLTSGVAAISSAYVHTCALLDTGGVKCWGSNGFGELGDGRRCGTAGCVDPVDVAGLQSGVTSISVGAFHTCAVLTGDGVKCWGNNYLGQLGNGESGRVISTTPVDVVEQHTKPTPTLDCPQEGCATPVRPEPPRTGLDFSIAIDANGDGIDDCTTHEEHRAECVLPPGSAFTVRVDLNALPPDMPTYDGFDATLIYAGIESTHKSVALWPDCGYPASFHAEHRTLFGCAAAINGLSTSVGAVGESHFTCAGNGSVSLKHGPGNTDLEANGWDVRYEAQRGGETLSVTCGDLVRGDVDCNVLVNPVDAALVLQREAVLIDTLGCPQQSDVNLDNQTNAVDAAITLQYTAGLVDVLPPQAAGLR